MRNLLCAFAVSLFSLGVGAQVIQNRSPEGGIAFLAHNDSIKSIDFHRGRISTLTNTGWVVYDSFATLPDPMRLLLHPTAIVTQTADTTLIHFSGSGLVYALRRSGVLERLDLTFFAGYNHGAMRYFDGTKLWSLGGSGLWNVHDLALYYDSELREWEQLRMKPEIPYGYTAGLYSELQPGRLISLVQDGNPSQPEPTFTAYDINLNQSTYTALGVASVRSEGPQAHQINAFGMFGSTNIIHHEGRLYLADIAANQMQSCEPLLDVYTTAFNGTHGLLLSPEKIYMIRSASTVTNVHVKIEPWTYDEFIARAQPKPIGSIYEAGILASIKSNWKPLFVVVFAGLFLTAFILKYQRSRPSAERDFAQNLSSSGRMVLRHLLLQQRDNLVSPDELNQVMGIEDKSWDNQRKIRSTVLQEIEEKGIKILGVPSFIERVPSPEDRRIRRYRIVPELRDDLLPILKHV